MTIRLVDAEWGSELVDAVRADSSALRIICPFIKAGALERLPPAKQGAIQVITRFNLPDCAKGVSDIAALRLLLDAGAQVRGVKNLHAKLYLFGRSRAVVTSANLTAAALDRNHEFGFVSDEPTVIAACRKYFDDLWARSGADLKVERIDAWDDEVTRYLAAGRRAGQPSGLADYGADAGIVPEPPMLPLSVADAPQAFVKFLGESHRREPLTFPTIAEIDRAGCHWAVAYPAGTRPRGVKAGAVIFISRLTEGPNDIRIFGRAIGMMHVPVRDDATPDDIERRPWKAQWPCYIRVHDAEFVAGSMANGVSLNKLMEALGADSFASTQRNAARGRGNTDPRRAYRQQVAVELSRKGFEWLSERLEDTFREHGKVPQDILDQLDWPALPIGFSSGPVG